MSGADAQDHCCEEVSPTAPPSRAVCGLTGLLAADLLVLRYAKACVLQTARYGLSPPDLARETPRSSWLLLLMQGLHFSSLWLSISSLSISWRHGSSQWKEGVVLPAPAFCETRLLLLQYEEGWKPWHSLSGQLVAFAHEVFECNVRRGKGMILVWG